MPRKPVAPKPQKAPWLAVAAICALALLPYLISVTYDFTFDDGVIVARNPIVQEWGHWKQIFWSDYWPGAHSSLYRPLTTLSFALERWLHGSGAAGFHFVNVVLHAGASALVFLIVVEIMGAGWGAALAGGLFALHPIHTEVVAGIVGRAELLSTLLGLGALYLVMRSKEASGIPRKSYVWALVLFFLAMAAKENAIVIFAFIILWKLSRLRMGKGGIGYLKQLMHPQLLGFAGTALVFLLLRAVVLGGVAASFSPNPPFVENPLAGQPTVVRVLTAISNQAHGLILNFWPWPLRADYSYQTLPAPSAGLSLNLLVMLFFAFVCLALWAIQRRWAANLAFASSWYLTAIIPASNILFTVGTLFAERLYYLPSAGFSIMVALLWGVAAGLHPDDWSIPQSARGRIMFGVAAAVLVVFMVLILVRLPVWKNDLALFTETVGNAPENVKARLWLGDALVLSGEYSASIDQYRKALEIYPDYGAAAANLVVPLSRLRRQREAIESGEKALTLLKEGSTVVMYNLALAYLDAGDPVRFLEYIQKVISIEPSNANARYQLGMYYWQQEANRDMAQRYFQQVLQIEPNSSNAANIKRLFPELR
jgi:protein O-mannosyl-transferase